MSTQVNMQNAGHSGSYSKYLISDVTPQRKRTENCKTKSKWSPPGTASLKIIKKKTVAAPVLIVCAFSLFRRPVAQRIKKKQTS